MISIIKSKKGFQLSLNMIITAVIAFVFLGIVIFIMQDAGGKIQKTIPEIIPSTDYLWQPTNDNPIMLKPATELGIKRGDATTITLQIYNYEATESSCNLEIIPGPDSINSGIKFTYAATNKAIPVGQVGQWKININVPRTTTANPYLYTVNADCGSFKASPDYFVNVQ